jgi:hypothetical protein
MAVQQARRINPTAGPSAVALGGLVLAPILARRTNSSLPRKVEKIMQDQKQSAQKKAVLNSDADPGEVDKLTAGDGVRQYEGGKNPAMQVQKSNRQGSGVPTQQRTEDR